MSLVCTRIPVRCVDSFSRAQRKSAHRPRIWAAFAVIAVLAIPSTARAQSPDSLDRDPANTLDRVSALARVPNYYVATPSGYFHPSCIRQLNEEDILDAEHALIRHADGSSEDIPACEYPGYSARGEVIDFRAPELVEPTISHSWIENASVVSSTSFGELNGTWIVPAAPKSNDGQTVYFFTGLEDAPSPKEFSILQPVLGWFSGEWTIASWNCCIKGTTFHSAIVPVKAGDTILGTMKNTCTKGTLSCSTWNITTKDMTSGESTTLSKSPSSGQTFNWAFSGVLEVYSIAKCSDYPPNGGLTISDVQLYDDSFKLVSNPGWSISWDNTDSPQCNYGVTPSATKVALDYGTSTFSVTPASALAFGYVAKGASATQKFIVENTGSATVSGSVSVPAPFSIASGGTYKLAPGAKQTVTVRFSPKEIASYKDSVSFTTGGVKRTVTGICVAQALPDLTVTAVSIPSSLPVGGSGQFSATIKNQGIANAGTFSLGFYISKTDSITASSVLIGACTYSSGLPTGDSSTCAGPLALPAGLEPGTYYGGAFVDYLDKVKESNKSDNTRMASHTLTIQ